MAHGINKEFSTNVVNLDNLPRLVIPAEILATAKKVADGNGYDAEKLIRKIKTLNPNEAFAYHSTVDEIKSLQAYVGSLSQRQQFHDRVYGTNNRVVDLFDTGI